jgi:hypothetical protein
MGLPKTVAGPPGLSSKTCATIPTKGTAAPTVLPTGVLQHPAYHL